LCVAKNVVDGDVPVDDVAVLDVQGDPPGNQGGDV